MFGRGDGVKIKLSGNADGTGVLSHHSFRCVNLKFKVPSSAFTKFTEMSSASCSNHSSV